MQTPIIISDFDGTISLQDINNELIKYYGDKTSFKIEEEVLKEEIAYKEGINSHYQRFEITEREFHETVISKFEIDPYFKVFYQKIKQENIPFIIVSGGFINYINILMNKAGIDFQHQIYANRLYFKGSNITVEFADNLKE